MCEKAFEIPFYPSIQLTANRKLKINTTYFAKLKPMSTILTDPVQAAPIDSK